MAFTFHARIAGSSALPATPWITWSSVSFCSKRSRNCRCSVGLGTSGLGDISANVFFCKSFGTWQKKSALLHDWHFSWFFQAYFKSFRKKMPRLRQCHHSAASEEGWRCIAQLITFEDETSVLSREVSAECSMVLQWDLHAPETFWDNTQMIFASSIF